MRFLVERRFTALPACSNRASVAAVSLPRTNNSPTQCCSLSMNVRTTRQRSSIVSNFGQIRSTYPASTHLGSLATYHRRSFSSDNNNSSGDGESNAASSETPSTRSRLTSSKPATVSAATAPTISSIPDSSTESSSKWSRKTKSKPAVSQEVTDRRTRVRMIREQLRRIMADAEARRWFTESQTFWALMIYFGICFGCLSYVWYQKLPPSRFMFAQPFILNINPERAHQIAVKAAQWPRWLRWTVGMCNNPDKDPSTAMKVWHHKFPSPLGLAAGFDKNGECVNGMLEMGFGFVEIGTVTPEPQKGNAKPRVFRLSRDKAIINRYGFPSHGHKIVKERLEQRLTSMNRSVGLVGINLGSNESSTSFDQITQDYCAGIKEFIDIADYLVINISCPNTEGLADKLQKSSMNELESLIKECQKVRNQSYEESYESSFLASSIRSGLVAACGTTTDSSGEEGSESSGSCRPPPPPLLVKIGPDMTDDELECVVRTCQKCNIDGMIVSNTTVSRNEKGDLNRYSRLRTKKKILNEKGGLSGVPLFEKSNRVLKKVWKMTEGQIPLIGVGGVRDAKDVYRKIKCGASLVQVYTGLAFAGPVLVKRTLREVGQYAELDGFNTLQECVGLECKQDIEFKNLNDKDPETEILMTRDLPRFERSQVAKTFGVLEF